MKARVFIAVVLLVLMYGATACPLAEAKERRLDAFQMRMLRSNVGVRWDEYLRNVDIRERLQQLPFSLKLKRARMGEERQLKRIIQDEGHAPKRS